MSENETTDSVHNEQFGKSENKDKKSNLEEALNAEENAESSTKQEKSIVDEAESSSARNDDLKPTDDSTDKPVKEEVVDENEVSKVDTPADGLESTAEPAKEIKGIPAKSDKEPAELPEQEPELKEAVLTFGTKTEPSSKLVSEDLKTQDKAEVAETIAKEESDSAKELSEEVKKKDDPAEIKANAADEEKEKPEPAAAPTREIIDYTKLSREDLVKVLKDLIDHHQAIDIRKDIEAIKASFYRSLKQENETIHKHFIEEGGEPEDFKIEEHQEEKQLKDLLSKYRSLRNELAKSHEQEKEQNLKVKYAIIESIKDLVNNQESLNKTFHDFRDLQNRWREVGPVPQSMVKNLWESYHYQVETFYDYIKINKELRDLDLKKNLEAKIVLCETAEGLLLEPSVVEAFRRLQKLHDQWREIGPVPIDKRSETWDRFKDATTKINRKHQDYFVSLKQEQKKNYEEKIVLSEKAEELAGVELDNHRDWEAKSKELIELQKIWKTIGFAPRKYNNQIYDRFRKACDNFFNKKREYYSHSREDQQNNLQLKTELCIQAEALKESTDWKKTTDDFIALQKKWKEIGPVSLKHSEKVWKRFRAACDVFFNNKTEFFSTIDSHYEENLNLKNQIIEEINNLVLSDDVEGNLKSLKDFQRKWSEIGFVPIKNKNEIQDRYRKAVNDKFDKLKLDDSRKSTIKFKGKLDSIKGKPNAQHRISTERDKCFNKLKQLESDIAVWENNIGFFSNSRGAESMISDVKQKIENGKKKIEELKNKIRILDEFE